MGYFENHAAGTALNHFTQLHQGSSYTSHEFCYGSWCHRSLRTWMILRPSRNLRAAEGGKSDSMRHLWRWYMLYLAIAFIVLIPVMYHHIVRNGLPKSILFFVIPAYLVMSVSFYKTFKSLKPK